MSTTKENVAQMIVNERDDHSEVLARLTADLNNERVRHRAALTDIAALVRNLPDPTPDQPPPVQPPPIAEPGTDGGHDFATGWKPGGVPSWHRPGGWLNMHLSRRGFRWYTSWGQAVFDTNQQGPGSLIMGSLRAYAMVGGSPQLLGEVSWPPRTSIPGGLFQRFPWYGSNPGMQPMPFSIRADDKRLITLPSIYPSSVSHWWLTQRVQIPSGATAVWTELIFQCQGTAAVSGGADFWVSPNAQWNGVEVNNEEQGCTEWRGRGSGWQKISLGGPGAVVNPLALPSSERDDSYAAWQKARCELQARGMFAESH